MTTKTQKIINNTIIYFILIVVSLFFVFPVFFMYMKSFMTTQELYLTYPKIFPDKFHFENYVNVFKMLGDYKGVNYFFIFLINTLKIMVGTTVGVVFSASFCAYGFCKIKFPGRDLIFTILLCSVMLPGVVTMIPLYIIFSKLGWLNTSLPLWVPMWFGGGAVNIFLCKQYMRTLPIELNECASIDGASPFRQYFSIILPNIVPILTVIGIGGIVGPWNDLMGPLMYLDVKEKWTLALAITMLGTNQTGEAVGPQYILAACGMMSILPLAVFAFCQKFMIESVVVSGIKG